MGCILENSILFHVKLRVEENEPEYYEYGIQQVLRNTVSLAKFKIYIKSIENS